MGGGAVFDEVLSAPPPLWPPATAGTLSPTTYAKTPSSGTRLTHLPRHRNPDRHTRDKVANCSSTLHCSAASI